MRYKHLLSVALGFMLSGSMAHAQIIVPSPIPPAWKLAWDHPGTNVEKFLLCVDAAPCVDVGLPVLTGQTPITPGLLVYGVAIPAMTPGPHTLTVRASFSGAEQPSDPFALTLVLVEAPKNLRPVKGSP